MPRRPALLAGSVPALAGCAPPLRGEISAPRTAPATCPPPYTPRPSRPRRAFPQFGSAKWFAREVIGDRTFYCARDAAVVSRGQPALILGCAPTQVNTDKAA